MPKPTAQRTEPAVHVQRVFIIPVLITAVILVLLPISLQLLTGVPPHVASTVAQVVVFALFVFLLYSALKKRQQTKRQVEELNMIIDAQYDLDTKQNGFMHTIAQELQPSVQELWALAESDEVPSQSRKFIEAGLKEISETIEIFGFVANLDEKKLKQDKSEVLLREIVEGVEGSVTKGDVKIIYDFSDSATVSHRSAIEKVLFALVSNALEHSGSKGSIAIRFRKTRKHQEIIVEDSGKGIAPDKIQILFKPLTRVEDTKEFSHQGRGMSLFVSRLVMRYIGGDITAESRLGKGTRMRIILPKQKRNILLT